MFIIGTTVNTSMCRGRFNLITKTPHLAKNKTDKGKPVYNYRGDPNTFPLLYVV